MVKSSSQAVPAAAFALAGASGESSMSKTVAKGLRPTTKLASTRTRANAENGSRRHTTTERAACAMSKEFIKLITPPLLVKLLQRLRDGARTASGVEWEYIPEGWKYAETHPAVKGWNVQDILETYKRKWPKFVNVARGTAPLGIAHESELASQTDMISHNTIMSFAYVVALAAHRAEKLSMLDWGGGMGHYCVLTQSLLPGVEIDYHCKDVPMLAEYGAQLLPDQHFYTDEACLGQKYDLVMASTSLHYTQDWQRLLAGLAAAARRYLYIANLPVVVDASSFVFVQRPYAYGYNTEYLAWCLNSKQFMDCAESLGLGLVREFIYGHRPLIHNAPEQNEYRGYLFRPARAG
jgi:putative methyltransferase (TIGR04325 family)